MIDGINLEAEKDYLSVLLNSPEEVLVNAEKVRTDLFCDPFHQKVVRKIRALLLESSPIEISTVSNNSAEQEMLQSIKSRDGASENFDKFFNVLEECLIARELRSAMRDVKLGLTEDTKSEVVPSEILHKLNLDIETIEQRRTTSIFTASEIIDKVVQRYLDIHQAVSEGEEYINDNVISTPFSSFNELLKRGGLSGGDLIIIAAPTSTGKTELALNLMSSAGIDLEKRGFVYSLEMTKEPLVERILLERSGVDSFRLERGNINEVDIKRLQGAATLIKESGLIFEDNLSADIFDIITSIRKAHYKHSLDVVMIDYLQLIKSPSKQGSRNEEVASICRMLKQESTRLNVPFIVLSQLSRRHEIEGREPILSDLRDSGAIEQDADLVLFLFATSAERKSKTQTKTKGILAKQREGAVGEFYMMNHKTIQTFKEISPIEFKKGQRPSQKSGEDEDEEIPF